MALLVTVDDGGERVGQIRKRIDSIEFAGFDERRDSRPVLCSGIMSGEKSILAVQRNAPFILPMSGMTSRSITAGIRISAREFLFAVSKNERQAGF